VVGGWRRFSPGHIRQQRGGREPREWRRKSFQSPSTAADLKKRIKKRTGHDIKGQKMALATADDLFGTVVICVKQRRI